MIDKIKLDISSKLNKKVNIKINNIRNKAEIFEGVIKELHSRIFVVESIDGINTTKYSHQVVSSLNQTQSIIQVNTGIKKDQINILLHLFYLVHNHHNMERSNL